MLRRLGWLIGLNIRSVQAKKLPDAKPHPAEVQPVVMLDSVQEIAIYIHRFHNLDLFRQGWDNDEYAPVGTPARVVQYEAPSLVSDEVFGVWRIDDTDNSFATQPSRIKYARQDVYLSIMVAFDLPIPENEALDQVASTDLKQVMLVKALLNAHDTLLAELQKLCDAISHAFDYVVDQALDQVASTDLKQVMLVKALLNAHDTLLAELQKVCDAINHAVDLTEFTSKMNDMKFFDSFLQEPVGADAEDPAQGKPQNGLERVNGRLEFQSDRLLHNLSKDDVLKIFNLSGDQVFYLWNTFPNFHRLAHTSSLPVLAVKHFLP
ncbi:protein FAM135B-like protein [Gossypium australe]|uniref:Protein FAM135B-like protein n=1 Tax=Gossypium australe TaxID=47621 RepID=A0A5B6W4I7_9ROSI|nr:protein FAM135B-like protein [Gossypium australe]